MKLLNIVVRDIEPEDIKPLYELNTAKFPICFHRTSAWKFVEFYTILICRPSPTDIENEYRFESTPDNPIYVCEGWRGRNNDGRVWYYIVRPCHKGIQAYGMYFLKEGGAQ